MFEMMYNLIRDTIFAYEDSYFDIYSNLFDAMTIIGAFVLVAIVAGLFIKFIIWMFAYLISIIEGIL